MEKEVMNLETVKSELIQEYNKTGDPAFEKAISGVLNSLDNLGYSIVPKNPEISASDLYNISNSMIDWITLPTEEGETLELQNIHIDQIIHSLQQAGWYILPPQ